MAISERNCTSSSHRLVNGGNFLNVIFRTLIIHSEGWDLINWVSFFSG